MTPRRRKAALIGSRPPIPVCAAALRERILLPHLIPKFHIDLKLFYPRPSP